MRALVVIPVVLLACTRAKPTPAPMPNADARFDFLPTAWEARPREEAPKLHVVEDLSCSGACDPLCRSLHPRDAARCALDIAYAAGGCP